MEKILGGLVLVNGTDIWSTYGVFLVEDKRGGMDNLTAILTPSKTKTDTAVNIREEDGEKYSSVLTPRNEARDVTLHFRPVWQNAGRLAEEVFRVHQFPEERP